MHTRGEAEGAVDGGGVSKTMNGVIATVRSSWWGLWFVVRVSGWLSCLSPSPRVHPPPPPPPPFHSGQTEIMHRLCDNVHQVASYKSEASLSEKLEEELWQRILNPVRRF